jgi:hypothetical protein
MDEIVTAFVVRATTRGLRTTLCNDHIGEPFFQLPG